ncbi:MAG: aldo/keto reductase [Planctomycetota bacterium]
MLYRRLPQLDRDLSILGFGGIVLTDRPQHECDAEVAHAIDDGFTYFDVAPQYGNAQELMGPALKPYRDRVTLACKTLQRSAEDAAAELDDSLAKLRTDRFDIYQLHSVTTPEDVDTILGPGGALEAFEAARDAGKARLLGFSAHDQQAALRLIETGRFDTILYPIHFSMYRHGVFAPAVVEAAHAKGMAIFALKAMSRCRVQPGEARSYDKCWYHPEDRADIAELLLRFTLSCPGVLAAVPPGNPGLFRVAVDAADRLDAPLNDAELERLTEAMADYEPVFPVPVQTA